MHTPDPVDIYQPFKLTGLNFTKFGVKFHKYQKVGYFCTAYTSTEIKTLGYTLE